MRLRFAIDEPGHTVGERAWMFQRDRRLLEDRQLLRFGNAGQRRVEILDERRRQDEMRIEPDELRALYTVSLKRLVPVGLVYLWPTTRL